MKTKIAIAVTALLITTSLPAKADLYMASPVGMSQAQWNQMDEYKNFTCPEGYGRGEGVNLNYTTTPADDFWFVKCDVITVYVPRIFPPTETTPIDLVPTETETSTATVVSNTTTPTNNSTSAVTSDTPTNIVETTTTTATVTSVTVESLYEQIMALFTQLLALIAKLNR
jgi:hypothetical protein